jgi:hypothetical protein
MNKKRTRTNTARGNENIVVRSVRNEHPDPRKLARVIMRLAFAQAEAEAAARAQHEANALRLRTKDISSKATTKGLRDAE